jgi:hypothetical protein
MVWFQGQLLVFNGVRWRGQKCRGNPFRCTARDQDSSNYANGYHSIHTLVVCVSVLHPPTYLPTYLPTFLLTYLPTYLAAQTATYYFD